MSLYEKKHEYQEIHIDTVEDIDKIIADYNFFYDLPRQGRTADDDPSAYIQAFLEDKVMNRGKYVPV